MFKCIDVLQMILMARMVRLNEREIDIDRPAAIIWRSEVGEYETQRDFNFIIVSLRKYGFVWVLIFVEFLLAITEYTTICLVIN